MSDSNLAERRTAQRPAKTRSRTVKPGHLEVGEMTSGHIGASSPFGSTPFPLPVSAIHFEHSAPVGTRHLDEERH
ncbi:hypothetical protein [Glycomyces paridis]|uniref:Uncharacterized protein n=1 Tax=Glycomyces paridis TaxID=2126555 RepID=A0A4S8P4K3_9ACTN|nr:hypothetical protein [Glycomyces paridis]THV24361.1 hypothetical protein E9998_21280 [Glycomyces paridis]